MPALCYLWFLLFVWVFVFFLFILPRTLVSDHSVEVAAFNFAPEEEKRTSSETQQILQILLDKHPAIDSSEIKCEKLTSFKDPSLKEYVHTHSFWQDKINENLENTYEDTKYFKKTELTFSTTHLKRPTYQWYATTPYCDGILHWENNIRQKGNSGCSTRPKDMKTPCEFKNLDYKKLWNPVNPKVAKEWYPYFEHEQITKIDIITIRKMSSYGTDFGICEKKLVLRESCGYAKRTNSSSRNWKWPFHKISNHSNIFVISQSSGYYHFIAESLPRLSFFLSDIVTNNYTVLVAHEAIYVTEFLELLGIENYVYGTKPNWIESGWTTEASWCTCNRHYPLAELSTILRQKISLEEILEANDIVVIRRTTDHAKKRRSIGNWQKMFDELVKTFPNENFVQFTDSNMKSGLKNWAKVFMKAKMIIGIFGAGLSNMVFAPPGTVIIELTSPGRGCLYLHMATSLGMRFYGYTQGYGHGYNVDPDEILDIVGIYLQSNQYLLDQTQET